MPLEVALQNLNEVFGIGCKSSIPKKLGCGLWFGIDGEDVVGQSVVVGCAPYVDVPGF